jgi:hypothetical protein
LVTEAGLDMSESVRTAARETAIILIKTKGQEHANILLTILEEFLEGVTSEGSSQVFEPKCTSLNETVILLTTLANYFGDTSMKKLVSVFETLLKLLNDPTTIRQVQESICKCIPQIAKYYSDKARENYLTQ